MTQIIVLLANLYRTYNSIKERLPNILYVDNKANYLSARTNEQENRSTSRQKIFVDKERETPHGEGQP